MILGTQKSPKKCLSYMFGCIHVSGDDVSKDDAYDDNNFVKKSIYQKSISNFNGVN
jgi:hypothetical protein